MLKLVQSISEINIHYNRQKNIRGLGDDVVYNEKYLALRQMIDVYNEVGGTILGCQEIPQE